MGNFIIFLGRVISLYLYFVVFACFLALVPNINMDYPLFHAIFTMAGFYLVPPILGASFSPMIVMTVCALLLMGLKKIYMRYFYKDETIVILSPEEFEKTLKEYKKQQGDEDNNDDSN